MWRQQYFVDVGLRDPWDEYNRWREAWSCQVAQKNFRVINRRCLGSNGPRWGVSPSTFSGEALSTPNIYDFRFGSLFERLA